MDPRMLMEMGNQAQSGVGQLFGGLFGNSGAPYKDAMNKFENYFGRARNYQNPFYEAGVGAVPQYQEWLEGQKDPSGFINKIMSGYQESPFAKFQQQQATRSAGNMGSATGLTGSTPLTQFAEQNARDISSQDMNTWLQNVLGVNTQYGAGQQSLISGGQGAANSMSNLMSMLGVLMGQGAYGQRAGENQDRSNTIGGILKLIMG